ncbi:hypothetical protein QV07_00065 [Gallibacterium genomosp. 3]|uniref:Uncharacterized protein n=1 Tax=Gallibacterium genomosp. 3 TaxID=505345 RepID=A0A1A7QFG3_9PAST|nr:hypothetical protein QV07_00065 [Gallibacterium genomosp. 3]
MSFFIRLFLFCLTLFFAFVFLIPLAMAFDAGIKIWNSMLVIAYILFFGSVLLFIMIPTEELTPNFCLRLSIIGFVIPLSLYSLLRLFS